MALSIGLVGLPNVGKSTLFQTITKKQVEIANYPFATIDPSVGVVAVPDKRVDELTKLSNSEKKIYTTIDFFDIAGLVEGANKGEGLGNKFLANIRGTDAIVYVLRAFTNDKIINVRNSIDPLSDKELLDTELLLKDLETIQKRLQGLKKEARSQDKEAEKELTFIKRINDLLEDGSILSEISFSDEEVLMLKPYQLLTMKPRLYLLNGTPEELTKETLDVFEKNNWSYLIVDVISEFETADLSVEERVELDMSPTSELDHLIAKAYELLGLITFLTTGPTETHAWTIKNGQKAPKAGGAIHGDFEERFIRADVISYEALMESGSYAQARENGQIQTEGKEYVVKDGDVIEIKHDA